jgi:hypothetical protein
MQELILYVISVHPLIFSEILIFLPVASVPVVELSTAAVIHAFSMP